MITGREAAANLHAAWRLFIRDPVAIERFENTPSGVVKSFSCAFIVLPGYGLILGYSPALQSLEVDPFRLVFVNLTAYVAGWAAWPLAMHYIAPLINRDRFYCRYIAAYNWSSGPFVMILLIMHIPVFFGIASEQYLGGASLLALVIVLLYHLFVVRVALRIKAFGAFGLVAAEIFLTHLISNLRDAALV